MKNSAYEEDSYLRELDTEVVEVGQEAGRPYAVLADTVLYPEGGGQPADRGWLSGVAVEDVRRTSGVIRNYLEKEITPGPVRVTLDWDRRFDHMQQHTGQHLVTAVAADGFGWPTTAFHLSAELSDVELDVPSITLEKLERLEEEVASEIRASRQVRWRRVTPESYRTLEVRTRGLPADHTGDIRLVEIDGIDLNTCGGTHVRSTAEIEALKILHTEPMRGGTRVYFVAGRRLRRLLSRHEKRGAAIQEMLSVPLEEVEQALAKRLEQLKDAVRHEQRFGKEVAELVARALSREEEAVVAAHFEEGDRSFLQTTAGAFRRQSQAKVALLTAGDPENGFFVLVAGEQVSNVPGEVGPAVAEILEGRGGGKGGLFQGKANALSKREEALRLVKERVSPG